MTHDDILNLINKKEEELKILQNEILDLKMQLGSFNVVDKLIFLKKIK